MCTETTKDTAVLAPDPDVQVKTLAADVMIMCRNRLTVDLRYMANPISMLKLKPAAVPWPMTDGTSIQYDPLWILKAYADEKQIPVRVYLHLVMHCIYMHFYISKSVCIPLWDLACDIAVEATICDLELPSVTTTKTMSQRKEIRRLRNAVSHMTAEVLYDYFLTYPPDEEEFKKLHSLFSIDSHLMWYVDVPEEQGGQSGSSSSGSDSSSSYGSDQAKGAADSAYGAFASRKMSSGSAGQSLRDEWLQSAEQMKMDIESFGRGTSDGQQGYDPGSGLMDNLMYAVRERYDYAAFLRQFGVMSESMKINDEEFDYSFYCYGLDTYGNVPLVEPLEYKDVKKLREFVIAIDTSGSTSGDLVRMFLTKTYNILMQRENFHTKVNVRIIQCDAAIQEDVKITSRAEFEEYINHMKVKGMGGTDFRPVFEHVNRLVNDGELARLKGLIYFTDGYGTFPSHQPPYKSAFVFVDDGYGQPEVPVWAIKLVLEPDDIEEIRE